MKKGIGFTGLINVALIVLKLCGIIKVSWLILIPIMLIIGISPFILAFIVLITINWKD